MESAIRLFATVALPFAFYFLGRLSQRRADGATDVRRWPVACLWVLAVGLAVAAIVAGIFEDRTKAWHIAEERARQTAETARRAGYANRLAKQIGVAEALARATPKGCPKGVDAEAWNARLA